MPKEKIAEEGFVPDVKGQEIDPSVCYHCRRTVTEFKCAKGERNQYRFCSIPCYNADTTV